MAKKKELLIIGKSLGGGGSEVVMIEFINHLDLKKYNVTLLLMDKDDEYKYRLKNNIKIEYVHFNSRFWKSIVSMYTLSGKILKKIKMNKYINIYNLVLKHTELNRNTYDIALDFYGYGAFTTELLAKEIKANKKATWLHDGKMPWLKNTARDLKCIDYVFGVSQAVVDSFVSKYPQFKNKALVFYNFLDIKGIKEKAQKPQTEKFDNGKLNIVTVGRLTEQKGYDVAIKAAKILKDKDINFRWYGIGEGRDRYKLEKMIKQFHLGDSFILLGRKDNPYNYMENCDIYIQPSRHEGYCTTITEALILNKMIIASDISENKEQIINNKNGLVTELTPQKLATKIIEICNNEELRNSILRNVEEKNINFEQQYKMLDKLF